MTSKIAKIRCVIGYAAAAVLTLGVFGYTGIITWFYLHQDSILYPGDRGDTSPAAKGLTGFEQVGIETPDGEKLAGWWKAPPEGSGVVLYLHGQTGSLGTEDYIVTRSRDMAAAGLGVLALDYRGYGGSTGHPSEAGLITDAKAAYDFIRRAAPDARIAIFGTSLGTAAAVALAAQVPESGLLLDSPFTSALHIAQLRYPWLPSAVLMRDHWDSESRIAQVNAPLLLVHCDADKTVPLAEGAELFAHANEPKTMIVLPGCGHIEIWNGAAREKILQTFQEWLNEPKDRSG
ncbi:MAG: alpha/beta hydrolase [Rhodospirillaceae bacterium]